MHMPPDRLLSCRKEKARLPDATRQSFCAFACHFEQTHIAEADISASEIIFHIQYTTIGAKITVSPFDLTEIVKMSQPGST